VLIVSSHSPQEKRSAQAEQVAFEVDFESNFIEKEDMKPSCVLFFRGTMFIDVSVSSFGFSQTLAAN
jgi:hypothetical protein